MAAQGQSPVHAIATIKTVFYQQAKQSKKYLLGIDLQMKIKISNTMS
jgi:hypothetical protein